MKYLLPFIFVLTLVSCKEQSTLMPAPTDENTIVKEDMENPVFSASKKAWKEKLFRTEGDKTAEEIMRENAYDRFKKRNTNISTRTPIESIADGLITGEWIEKGSINQAGSVFKTAYDDTTDELFLVSAGGHIWKGGLDGFTWEVVNERARFNVRFLEVGYIDGNRRIAANINRIPHYSDDDGQTWIPSNIPFFVSFKDEVMAVDGTQRIFVIANEPGDTNSNLYVSNDLGATYTKIHSFITNDMNLISLAHIRKTDEMYILESLGTICRVYKMNSDKTAVDLIQSFSPLDLQGRSARFVASVDEDGTPYLYALTNQNGVSVFRSIDEGVTWTDQGTLPSNPWGVGIFVSSQNPDFLMYGDIECYRSFDGGQNWEMINGWAEYYGDVVNKLHADMMWFSDYVDQDTDEYFMLISNHGGISKMFTYDQQPTNFSLIGLNVSQYYSVRTSPGSEEYIYAGSQDQGFQRGADIEDEALILAQPISGDYGHIQFTTNGKLWTVYPGGWISFWPQPNDQGITASYTIESTNESVWIPPLAAPPHEFSDHIYAAGGNINGGSGSYIVRLEAVDNQINASQLDFDFRAASGGVVSAITVADEFEQTIYAATDNGVFFTSNDFGETFTKSDDVPGGHYLYGQAIVASKTNKEIVYTGGNGFNGVPCMKSIDGGVTFENYSDGLPSTVILGMAMNDEESLLFAATTSGPFVCILSQNKWYSMLGESAPDVTYWSVELVNNDQTVRFGTYGRGIYDFQIDFFVSNEEEELHTIQQTKLFPNPVSSLLTIEWAQGTSNAQILSMDGQLIQEIPETNGTSQLNIDHYTTGSYILQTIINGKTTAQIFQKQ